MTCNMSTIQEFHDKDRDIYKMAQLLQKLVPWWGLLLITILDQDSLCCNANMPLAAEMKFSLSLLCSTLQLR